MNTFVTAPLPVDLLSFEGKQSLKGVTLRWETAWEEGNSHFVVERSLNGIKAFEEVGMVAGQGTTDKLQYYDWTDPDIKTWMHGSVYYRLRQVDFNGQFEYSRVVGIHLHSLWRPVKLIKGNFGEGRALTLNIPERMQKEEEIQV